MKRLESKKKTGTLMALLLFGIFAVCILSVLLTGADTYRRLSQRDALSYDLRTAEQYLTTRVHQSDYSGGITVGEFYEADALLLREMIDGQEYQTLIYCHDGWLRELFISAEDTDFLPEAGEKILEMQSLSLTLDNGTLSATITHPSGRQGTLALHLRSEEVAP